MAGKGARNIRHHIANMMTAILLVDMNWMIRLPFIIDVEK